MRNFVSVPSNLYVLKSYVEYLEDGGEVKGYITVNDPSEYELINKHAFQPALKVNDNTYLVTLIFK